MKSVVSWGFLGFAVLILSATAAVRATSVGQQMNDAERAFGTWSSIEQFESDHVYRFSFRRTDRSIAGWAISRSPG